MKRSVLALAGLAVAALALSACGQSASTSESPSPVQGPTVPSSPEAQPFPDIAYANTPVDAVVVPKAANPADDPNPWGWYVNGYDAKKPTLEIWEDPQCSGCQLFETSFMGEEVRKIIKDGSYNVLIQPTAFLDQYLQNDASMRAVNAWGCAIDQGVGPEYKYQMYADQKKEGTGYTDADFVTYAKRSLLEGKALNEFKQCLTDAPYRNWGPGGVRAMKEHSPMITATPWLLVNGVTVDGLDKVHDAAAFRDALAKTAGNQ